jgi:hypothetical protein
VLGLVRICLTILYRIFKRNYFPDSVYAINKKTGKGEKVRLDKDGNLPPGYS